MDAGKLSSLRTAFLFSLALLIPASAFSQTAAFNLNSSGTAATTVTLIGTNPSPVSVASTLTPTTEITYQAITTYGADSNGVRWMCLNPSNGGTVVNTCDSLSGLVTPDTLNLQIGQNANSSQLTATLHTATITLTGYQRRYRHHHRELHAWIERRHYVRRVVGFAEFAQHQHRLSGQHDLVFQPCFQLVRRRLHSRCKRPSPSWATNFITSSGSIFRYGRKRESGAGSGYAQWFWASSNHLEHHALGRLRGQHVNDPADVWQRR